MTPMSEQLSLFEVEQAPMSFVWGRGIVWRTGRVRQYWGFGDESHCGRSQVHTNLKVLFRKLVDDPEAFYAFTPYAFDEWWIGKGRPSFLEQKRYGAMKYELFDRGATVQLVEQPCACREWAVVGPDYECRECTRMMDGGTFDATYPNAERVFRKPLWENEYGDNTLRVIVDEAEAIPKA
jgi:hypothetical protein